MAQSTRSILQFNSIFRLQTITVSRTRKTSVAANICTTSKPRRTGNGISLPSFCNDSRLHVASGGTSMLQYGSGQRQYATMHASSGSRSENSDSRDAMEATSESADSDLRKRLTTELKNAMKGKDKFSSTVLRSVLSEVYLADKTAPSGQVSSSAIVSILKKGIDRRTNSASEYTSANRVDLALTETQEAEYLSRFVPPVLSESAIDEILAKLIFEYKQVTPFAGTEDFKRATGIILKEFFGQVDKSVVDGRVVKRRLEVLLK